MTHDLHILSLTDVDRSSAIRELPTLHAVAIRLRDGGFDDQVIAVALEIEDAQVPTLLQIANSKLENLIALDVFEPPRSDVGHRKTQKLTNRESRENLR
jgi:hypothetical protein